MWRSAVFLLGAAASCCIAPNVQAHGYMTQPKPHIKPSDQTNFNTADYKLDASVEYPAFNWNDAPERNAATFNSLLKGKKLKNFKNIRALIDDKVKDCGHTLNSGARIDVSSMKEVQWRNNADHGFVDSHHGPCEVWIDNTLVFHHDDCSAKFAGQIPAKIPVNFSKCSSGKCLLRVYWVALHTSTWEFYKQCAPIEYRRKGSKLRQ